jgi:hypothetical protein
MKPTGDGNTLVLPPALMAAVVAAADESHRSIGEIVREALESYLAQSRRSDMVFAPRTPTEAAGRMRQRRAGNRLPDGTTIRDLMTHGRA